MTDEKRADSCLLRYGIAKMLVLPFAIFLAWLAWRALNPSLDTTLFRELAVAGALCAMIWNAEPLMLVLAKRGIARADARAASNSRSSAASRLRFRSCPCA